jgi:glutamate synthase domain-containing protein 3
MAALGYRNFDEMVGQSQRLSVDESKLHYKSKGLDLAPLLRPSREINPKASAIVHTMRQDHELEHAIDVELVAESAPALERGEKVVLRKHATNLQRTLGTMLSYEISTKFGRDGLPPGSITVHLTGHGGQSLGFCLASGVHLSLEGDCNDGCGKGLSGGTIAVFPSPKVEAEGFVAASNVVVGNVCLYGASRGSAYFAGKAGERFAVRNSGAYAVVEGVGDHGCEYMTGGRVVVLGETGRNFAAGMSGGIAYVLDPLKKFPERCNMGMVALEAVEGGKEAAALKAQIEAHVAATGSAVGKALLRDWSPRTVAQFVKVMPVDYKRVLEKEAALKLAA